MTDLSISWAKNVIWTWKKPTKEHCHTGKGFLSVWALGMLLTLVLTSTSLTETQYLHTSSAIFMNCSIKCNVLISGAWPFRGLSLIVQLMGSNWTEERKLKSKNDDDDTRLFRFVVRPPERLCQPPMTFVINFSEAINLDTGNRMSLQHEWKINYHSKVFTSWKIF